MPKAASEKVTKAKKEDGGAKKQLSPYMKYMKETLATYKAEHPGVAHKEAFSKVAAMWADADENPNKGKPKADKKAAAPKKKKPAKKAAVEDEDDDAGDDDE